MAFNKSGETTGGRGRTPQTSSSSSVKVYGYLDVFKSIGDALPLQTYQMTLTKIYIGRESSCQIRIQNSRVSRQQCAVKVVYDRDRNLEVHLENLTTRPTTVYKGKGISSGEEITLQHGDRFRLYDVELRYRLYDPVNERGQLDWSRPIPVIRVTPPPPTAVAPTGAPPAAAAKQQQQPSPPPLPSIKVTKPPPEELTPKNKQQQQLPISPPPKSKLDFRRQSFPLSTTGSSNGSNRSKMDYLKLPRSNSMKLPTTANESSNSNNNRSSRKANNMDQEIINSNNNRNKKPVAGQVSYKRRGSSDFDMRKAVLQRSFRRAFKEKISQGTLIDVNEGRFRRALEDFMVLSSAA